MFEALNSDELTGMWVQVTNPMQTIPNLKENMPNIIEFEIEQEKIGVETLAKTDSE